MSAIERLAEVIRKNGPIKTVRVSVARQGACKWGPYYDAVAYEIRLDKRGGHPTHVALERASKRRRSYRLAVEDMIHYAITNGRICFAPIGRLDEHDAEYVLGEIPETEEPSCDVEPCDC